MPDADRKQVHTFCRICDPGCGLVASLEGQELIALQPDKAHPVHKGYACHKGIHFKSVHTDPERLNYPLAKSQDSGFREASWSEVVSEIAMRLERIHQESGETAIAAYQGNPSAYSSATYYHSTGLLRKLGCGRFFSAGTQDCSAKFASSEAMYGAMMLHPYADLLHTDYLLCIGANPKVSHMSFLHVSNPMDKLKAITRRGGKICHVNPRAMESSNRATGEVLRIRPDTDLYFLAGVINEIVTAIGYDEAWVEQHSKNFDDVLRFVEPYSIDRVAGVVGVAADDIRTVARDFASAGSASVHVSTGVNQGRQGALCYWLANMLSLMTGNLGKRGGNIYSPNFFPMARFSKPKTADPYFETRHGVMRLVGNDLPANLLIDMINDPDAPIRAMIVVAGNPVLSLSGGKPLRQALQKLELLVVIDIYRSATAELADYVLPATDWLEHEDVNSLGASVGVALEPYVQYTPAVVPPKAGRRDDWWILASIAQAMGRKTLLDESAPNPLGFLSSMLESSDLSLEALKGALCQTVVLPAPEPMDLFRIGVQHEDGKVDCGPNTLRKGWPRARAIFDELCNEPPGQLKLISRRTNYMINSWMHNVEVLKVKSHQTNPLYINASDAAARGLHEGMPVMVASASGELATTISIDDSLRDGVVAMTHGWGNGDTSGMRVAQTFPGTNVNALSPVGPGSYDALSNQSHMTGINVDVTPA